MKLFDIHKTRMIGLPRGEETMVICYAVSVEYRKVTDGRRDGRTELLYQYSATSNYMKLVHWPLMGGLLHVVQRAGDWAGP